MGAEEAASALTGTSVLGATESAALTTPARVQAVGGDVGLASRGVRPAPGARTIEGVIDQAVQAAGGEVTVIRPSGGEVARVGSGGRHGIPSAHAHESYGNVSPSGQLYTGLGNDAVPANSRHIRELTNENNTTRTRGGN